MKQVNLRSSEGCGITRINEAAIVHFPDVSFGYKSGHKILVAYASEFGTTSEVAEVIGKALCQSGALVDVKWVKNISDLENYDAVIIGSAIQYDKWMPDAVNFVSHHQNSLSKLPVAFFFTCLTLAVQNVKAERQARAYSDKLYNLLPAVKPISIGRFAGALDFNKLPFLSRQIFKIISFVTSVREGDYRDWEGIHAWAIATHSKLLANASLKTNAGRSL